jgi:hypothetical protein
MVREVKRTALVERVRWLIQSESGRGEPNRREGGVVAWVKLDSYLINFP